MKQCDTENEESAMERAIQCSCVAMKLGDQLTDEKDSVPQPAHFALAALQSSAWAYRKGLWRNGQVIKIRFINGSSTQREAVMHQLRKIDEKCGLVFKPVLTGPSQCRIGFDLGAGHWSYVGVDNLHIPQNQKTMNIGLTGQDSEKEYGRVVIHEGFHLIGLGHEHQHPRNTIPWNREMVYRLYGKTQGWSRAEIDQQVLNRLSPVGIVGTPTADKSSIMMYPIDKILVTDPSYTVGWNFVASDLDWATVQSFYP